MYSLNQVNKLVSCGRDPARSLPLWRGFLLIPLILVCFAFAPNAQTAPETPDPPPIPGAFNTGDGTNALRTNITGAGNSAFGFDSIAQNIRGSFNTGAGAFTLLFNRADENTAVGFNNTYVGQFVGDNNGTPIADEDLTIRIADVSVDGFGSAACFIGGIFNNPQPVGRNVVAVTLNLDTDQLGVDMTMGRPGAAPAPHRSGPQPRMRPEAQHQAMLNDKVEKLQATVTQQQATVAQQQKQIEALTAQLREQAAQIQKVSAQLKMVRPTPRVVENR